MRCAALLVLRGVVASSEVRRDATVRTAPGPTTHLFVHRNGGRRRSRSRTANGRGGKHTRHKKFIFSFCLFIPLLYFLLPLLLVFVLPFLSFVLASLLLEIPFLPLCSSSLTLSLPLLFFLLLLSLPAPFALLFLPHSFTSLIPLLSLHHVFFLAPLSFFLTLLLKIPLLSLYFYTSFRLLLYPLLFFLLLSLPASCGLLFLMLLPRYLLLPLHCLPFCHSPPHLSPSRFPTRPYPKHVRSPRTESRVGSRGKRHHFQTPRSGIVLRKRLIQSKRIGSGARARSAVVGTIIHRQRCDRHDARLARTDPYLCKSIGSTGTDPGYNAI